MSDEIGNDEEYSALPPVAAPTECDYETEPWGHHRDCIVVDRHDPTTSVCRLPLPTDEQETQTIKPPEHRPCPHTLDACRAIRDDLERVKGERDEAMRVVRQYLGALIWGVAQ